MKPQSSKGCSSTKPQFLSYEREKTEPRSSPKAAQSETHSATAKAKTTLIETNLELHGPSSLSQDAPSGKPLMLFRHAPAAKPEPRMKPNQNWCTLT
jgi:hypothetical protein